MDTAGGNAEDALPPIRLRPHHLLCMLTFAGHGYSAGFVANFETIISRLRAGARVQLVDGPDDVCAPLCRNTGTVHCFNASVIERDAAARAALADLPQLAIIVRNEPPTRLDAALVTELRRQFVAGTIRAACVGCEWSSLCTQIAVDGFRTARL